MLVVIGIAGLLFILIGPAFNRMARGNAVESHASGLKLGMERASSLAAASRRYVAVILPYKLDSGKTNYPGYKYQRGGYRLAYVTQGSSGAYTFDGWLPDSEWQNQGRDAYLVDVTEANNSGSKPVYATADSTKKMGTDANFEDAIGGHSHLHDVADVKENDGATPYSYSSCKGIIFSPYGGAVVSSSDPELKFYITGTNFYDRVALRLNVLSGKVEFVEP